MRLSYQVGWAVIASLCQGSGSAFGSPGEADVDGLTRPEFVVEGTSLERQTSAWPVPWLSRAETVAGSRRWSLSRGPFEIGMSTDAFPPAERSGFATERPGMVPTFSIGVHDASARQGRDATSLIARAARKTDGDAATNRIGFEWKPPPPRWNVGREGLAVRLQGNDRMTMRLRNGALAIYAQRTF